MDDDDVVRMMMMMMIVMMMHGDDDGEDDMARGNTVWQIEMCPCEGVKLWVFHEVNLDWH